MPLSEIVFDFYDKLKSISKGYASFDYHRTGYQPLEIGQTGHSVERRTGRRAFVAHLCRARLRFRTQDVRKLKELIPRQQFDIAIQAAIGAKIIARETVKAVA